MMQMGNYFPYMPKCSPAISEAMSLMMLNRHHKQARTWWEPLAHWVGLGNTYWSVKWQWSPALQWLAFKYLLLSTKPLALLFLQKKTVGIVVIPPQETLAGKQVLPTNHVSAAFSNSELSSSPHTSIFVDVRSRWAQHNRIYAYPALKIELDVTVMSCSWALKPLLTSSNTIMTGRSPGETLVNN